MEETDVRDPHEVTGTWSAQVVRRIPEKQCELQIELFSHCLIVSTSRRDGCREDNRDRGAAGWKIR
jgi:hypothetical protein